MTLSYKHIVPGIFVLIAILSILWWQAYNPVADFTTNNPGLDNRGSGSGAEENIMIGELFERLDEQSTSLNEEWPRFRGEHFDNIYQSDINLLNKFDQTSPPILWSVELGEGHAGPAIYDGYAYILDYDETQRADLLRCFLLKDGTELWRRGYHVNVKRNHGMSRTVPAITDDFILTIGPRCHVMCVERENGDFLWGIDVEKEYESEVPLWYTGQCPLIDDGIAVIATGGNALMIGVDCQSGEIIWKTINPDGWKMSHSSIMPFTFGGKKMYVYAAVGGVVGITANGPDRGSVLWKTAAFNHSVIAPSPVCMPDGKIFLTAGYGAGSMMLQLSENAGEFSVEILQEYKPSEGLACEQQTPVFYKGHLFGILPKDGGTMRNQMVCVHPDDCRKIVWSSGKTTRFGLGPFMVANDQFFLLNEDGTFYSIQPSTSAYRQTDAVKIFDGHDAWAPLAIADGYMLLRDANTMYCINIKR